MILALIFVVVALLLFRKYRKVKRANRKLLAERKLPAAPVAVALPHQSVVISDARTGEPIGVATTDAAGRIAFHASTPTVDLTLLPGESA